MTPDACRCHDRDVIESELRRELEAADRAALQRVQEAHGDLADALYEHRSLTPNERLREAAKYVRQQQWAQWDDWWRRHPDGDPSREAKTATASPRPPRPQQRHLQAAW